MWPSHTRVLAEQGGSDEFRFGLNEKYFSLDCDEINLLIEIF